MTIDKDLHEKALADNQFMESVRQVEWNEAGVKFGWLGVSFISWQAARAIDAKRISELEIKVEKLTNANDTWLEWRDEQVKQLEALQAREKVLVEALEGCHSEIITGIKTPRDRNIECLNIISKAIVTLKKEG